MTKEQRQKLPIRHIGTISAICNKGISMIGKSLREDLSYARYKQLGVTERFKDEKPYRICDRCLAMSKKKESSFNR